MSAMHITAGVWVNDDGPGIRHQVILPITRGPGEPAPA